MRVIARKGEREKERERGRVQELGRVGLLYVRIL